MIYQLIVTTLQHAITDVEHSDGKYFRRLFGGAASTVLKFKRREKAVEAMRLLNHDQRIPGLMQAAVPVFPLEESEKAWLPPCDPVDIHVEELAPRPRPEPIPVPKPIIPPSPLTAEEKLRSLKQDIPKTLQTLVMEVYERELAQDPTRYLTLSTLSRIVRNDPSLASLAGFRDVFEAEQAVKELIDEDPNNGESPIAKLINIDALESFRANRRAV